MEKTEIDGSWKLMFHDENHDLIAWFDADKCEMPVADDYVSVRAVGTARVRYVVIDYNWLEVRVFLDSM